MVSNSRELGEIRGYLYLLSDEAQLEAWRGLRRTRESHHKAVLLMGQRETIRPSHAVRWAFAGVLVSLGEFQASHGVQAVSRVESARAAALSCASHTMNLLQVRSGVSCLGFSCFSLFLEGLAHYSAPEELLSCLLWLLHLQLGITLYVLYWY